jgi:ligand-binding sensor domain-containing protein/tRNA A-37 threonylcarbamoyl transferase component Bud32
MDNIQPGQNLGPYRIINQIGQGGMATVYKAYHAAMDRYVAVKVLPRQLAESAEFLGRFQQEAHTIANLEHPHILPVHDYGESDGITYLVMRFLDAGTLKERLQSGPLSLAEIDRLFAQLADALAYAHEHDVIHRDLKPSNVLVDARGNLFLTDFGIAKLLAGSAQFTSTGAMIGTPAYMSPEQAQGQNVDQRSDIYSLGIILYEMVTGRVPFEAETPLAVVLKHLQEPLPLPSTVKPGVSPSIERVILKALAKNPDDRFASVAEFLAAWRQALSEVETVRAAAPAATETMAAASPATEAPTRAVPAISPPERKALPIRWMVGGVGILALLALAVFAAAQIGRALRPAPEATPAPTTKPQPTAALETSAPPTSEPLQTAKPTTGPVTSGKPEMTSWTAGNTILGVRAVNDNMVTWGPGGVTVWNRADGTVLRRITTGDGLPSPDVNAVLMDDDGTIWVGTGDGLGRYDPADGEWTIYTTEDGLDSDTVMTLARVGDKLIAGTYYSGIEGGGLNVFDGKGWERMPDFPSAHPDEKPELLANFVNGILPDPSGALWVATSNGLGRYDRDSQTWKRFSTENGLPNNRILTLFFDQHGNLFVGTDGGAARFNGESFEAVDQSPPDGVYGIVQDAQGRYYFSGGGGIWRFDSDKADWKEFSERTDDLPAYGITAAAQDDEGRLYFGTDGEGLVVYDGKDFKVWAVPDVPIHTAFSDILRSLDGNELWFMEDGGTYPDRFNLQTGAWEPYAEPPCSCAPIVFDAQGSLWGAEWQNGLWIVAPDGHQTHVGADQGFPLDDSVFAIAFAPDGTAWAGTDKGVALFDGKQITQILNAKNTGFATDEVRSLLAASDGSMWVGTWAGLSRLAPDGQWEHYTVGSPFSDNLSFVADIAEDQNGAVWVATQGDWVYRYSDGKWEQFKGEDPGVELPSPDVNSVTIAPDGSVWFGTSGGAAHFDGDGWESFDVGDGLIFDRVNDIFVSEDGTAWFATGGGVTQFAP